MPLSTAGLLLCGGFSRRMGRDKASLQLGGRSLLERTGEVLAQVADEVLVVAREGQEIETGGLSARVVRDAADGLGPLAGIVTGLEATTAEAGLVVSCDQPFLDVTTLRRLLEAADREITLPRLQGRLLPTTAVYRRSVLPVARRLLDERRLRPIFLLEQCSVRVLEGLDPAPFRDVDTPEDWAEALRSAGYTPPSR